MNALNLNRLPAHLSLKTRFALAAGALVVFVAIVLTAAAAMIGQRGIEDVVRDREASLASQLAHDLDYRIELRQGALLRLASDFAQGAPIVPDRLQQRLEQYHALGGLFSNLSMVDVKGDQVANLDAPEARGRQNFSHREHFIETMRTGAPVISRPVMDQVAGRPLVIMTAPIRAADGRIAYLLIGMIDLGRDSFLSALTAARIDQGSHFYLMTSDGVYVAHPDAARLLTRVGARGDPNAALRQGLGADDGTVRATLGGSGEALVTTRRMRSTGWVLAAVYPTAQAFAFTDQVRLNAAIIAMVLIVVIAPVMWLVIDHELRPLARLAEHMRAGSWSAQASYREDELGELARAFDQLMDERQRAAQAVAESERNLRLVADNVPALVAYVDSEQRFVFGNERYKTLFGDAGDQLRGKRVVDVIGATMYAASQAHILNALRGERVCFERPRLGDGRLNWDRVSYNPDFDEHGKVRGYFALVDDISELKSTQLVLAASEKRIRTITDALPVLIAYVDTGRRYRFCNSGYTAISGRATEDIIGKSVAEVFGAKAYEAVAGNMDAALRGERISFEHVDASANSAARGAPAILQYDYIPDIGSDGKVAGIYTMVQDVTSRKQTENALMSQQRLLRSVADNLPALVNSIDTNGRIRFANRQHVEWTGLPLERIEGAPIASLLNEQELAAHQHFFNKAMQGERTRWSFERRLRGEPRYYQADYIPQTEGGVAVGVTCLVNDVTDTKQVERQLNALARFDALTGLPNRTHLVERIARALVRSSRSGTRVALMYLDLDKFKSINDNFGHGGGDAVLVEFGRRLCACVRQSDTVGRLAGDEFVILLEGLQGDAECARVAGKIISSMERPFDIDGVARIVTTSVGVATCGGGAASVDGLLKHADEALYRAKEKGRNRYALTALA